MLDHHVYNEIFPSVAGGGKDEDSKGGKKNCYGLEKGKNHGAQIKSEKKRVNKLQLKYQEIGLGWKF